MFKKVIEIYLNILKDRDFLSLDTFADDPDTYRTPFFTEEVIGLKYILEDRSIRLSIVHTQDAFFSLELSASFDVKDNAGQVSYTRYATIRFSEFGRLFTIIGNNNVLPNIEVVNYLENLGFIYIPKEVLELPYEGHNRDAMDRYMPERKHTWYNRYFDYI